MPSFKITRGDTSEFEVTILDESGVPEDLTGAKVWFSGRTPTQADLLWSINSVDDPFQVFWDTPASGVVSLILSASDTSDLPTNRPVYFDVQLKRASGTIHTVQKGTIKVDSDVTQLIV